MFPAWRGLEIDGSPERPVLLGAYHHAVAPSDWRTQGDLLQYAKADVPVEACLHLVLPMNRDGNGPHWDLFSGIGEGSLGGAGAHRRRTHSLSIGPASDVQVCGGSPRCQGVWGLVGHEHALGMGGVGFVSPEVWLGEGSWRPVGRSIPSALCLGWNGEI